MTETFPAHLAQLETDLKRMQTQKKIYTLFGIAATALVVYVGIDVANTANATPFSQGISKIFDFPRDMIALSWELGFSRWFSRVLEFIPDLITTFNMALFSTGIGFFFAVVLSCFASKNIVANGAVVLFTRRVLDLLRSFPELIIAMVFLYLMGKSEIPAIIAIALHTVGALGKLFSEAIENIDPKPLEGLQSVGGGWTSRVRFGVLPQVMPLLLSYSLLRLEINVRASTILGFVGAGGIGEALSENIQWRDGARVTAILLLLVLTIVALDYFSTWVRSKLIGSRTQ